MSLINRPASKIYEKEQESWKDRPTTSGNADPRIWRKEQGTEKPQEQTNRTMSNGKRPSPEEDSANEGKEKKRDNGMEGRKAERKSESGKGPETKEVEIESTTQQVAEAGHYATSSHEDKYTRRESERNNRKDNETQEVAIEEKRGEIRGGKGDTRKSEVKRIITQNKGGTSEEGIEKEETGNVMEVQLRGKADTGRKNNNVIRIYRALRDWNRFIEAIRMTGKRRAVIVFKKDSIAREVLKGFRDGGNKDYHAYVPNRMRQR